MSRARIIAELNRAAYLTYLDDAARKYKPARGALAPTHIIREVVYQERLHERLLSPHEHTFSGRALVLLDRQ